MLPALASHLRHLSLWVLCGLGSCVELNRSSFLEPEGLPKARKSVFITRKLMVSVGEIVNGGPLPPAPRHIPVCSFNFQNKYVGESLATDLCVGSQRPGVEAAGERSCSCGEGTSCLSLWEASGEPKHLSYFGAQMGMLVQCSGVSS